MSIRTSIILVVSLAMMAGYVIFVQLGKPEGPADEPPWFYNVDMTDMSRIAVTKGGNSALFFLGTDGRWHLDAPNGLPVGLDRWSGVDLLLSGPKSSRLIDEQPEDLEPYGLDSPVTIITIHLKDGRSVEVLLGLPTPDNVGTYGQLKGFPQVFTIFGGWEEVMARLITTPPYPEWYYNVAPSTVTSIQLSDREKGIALTKDAAGWYFQDATQSPVDDIKFASLLASLEKPPQAIVEYNAFDLAQYGLNPPSLALFLQVERSDEEGFTVISQSRFRIGNATEDGTGYYAQTERGESLLPDVFKVDAAWVEGLNAILDNPPYPDDVEPEETEQEQEAEATPEG